MAKETFFAIRTPAGVSPRRWGKQHGDRYGFDYDNVSQSTKELLAWPSGITAAILARRLRAAGVPFNTFQADPAKMFGLK